MFVPNTITYCDIHTTLNQYEKARGPKKFGQRATCCPVCGLHCSAKFMTTCARQIMFWIEYTHKLRSSVQ